MALQDVETELERLRVKAAAKVRRRSGTKAWAERLTFSLSSCAGQGVPSAALLRTAQAEDKHPGALRCRGPALSAWRSLTTSPPLGQILQQSVFLKFKYFVKFLQQHGQEVFAEVRTAYVETLSRIYRSALCASPWPDLPSPEHRL